MGKGPCKMQGSAPEETASLDGDAFNEWIDPGLSAQWKRWIYDAETASRRASLDLYRSMSSKVKHDARQWCFDIWQAGGEVDDAVFFNRWNGAARKSTWK